LAVTC